MEQATTELIHFDTAKRELALANSIDEVKLIRDQAEAIRQYIRQQKGSFSMQNQAAEIKIRAERRVGEMLKEPGREKPGEYKKLHDETFSPKPSLEDLGITKIQSHRWQLEAEIPETQFEEYIAETKAKAEELTSRAALSIALRMRHEDKKRIFNNTTSLDGLFDVIVVDPPWPYGGGYNPYAHRGASPYNEMSIEEIMMLEIPAAKDCILWLWVTNRFMHDAYHVLESWAFEPKTILTWFKEKIGVGRWLRGATEHCILGISGKPNITHVAQSTALICSARNHSQKPEEFYTTLESLCPGKKLEMFARTPRQGWQSHGDQLQNN